MQATIDQVVGDQTVDVVDVGGDQRVYPKFKNFLDVVRRRDELLEAVKRYPLSDVIYFFPHLRQMATVRGETYEKRTKLPKEFLEGEWNWCIAGSSALFKVQNYLKDAMKTVKDVGVDLNNFLRILEGEGIAGKGMIERGEYIRLREMIEMVVKDKKKVMNLLCDLDKIGGGSRVYGNFRPSDTDIFFLNSVANHRYLMSGVDIVHTKAKTVDELLLNFDLPCCRAGFNSRSDFWVSAQCLVSLLYGYYYLPSFIQDQTRFSGVLSRYRTSMNTMDKFLHGRLLERIHKYGGYGFNVIYIDGDIVPEWIRNRFHYGEWKQERFCFECQHNLPFDKVQSESCYLCGGYKCLKLHGGVFANEHKVGGKTFCADCQSLCDYNFLELVGKSNLDSDDRAELRREYGTFCSTNGRFPSLEEIMKNSLTI